MAASEGDDVHAAVIASWRQGRDGHHGSTVQVHSCGSIYSYLSQGTGNIGECLAFGRIAGRNAAAEQPWC